MNAPRPHHPFRSRARFSTIINSRRGRDATRPRTTRPRPARIHADHARPDSPPRSRLKDVKNPLPDYEDVPSAEKQGVRAWFRPGRLWIGSINIPGPMGADSSARYVFQVVEWNKKTRTWIVSHAAHGDEQLCHLKLDDTPAGGRKPRALLPGRGDVVRGIDINRRGHLRNCRTAGEARGRFLAESGRGQHVRAGAGVVRARGLLRTGR